MGSFALYSDVKEGERLKADVHFNLWSCCGWKNEPPYLDVGIMVHNLKREQKIYFYVPFQLKKDEVIDLGKRISEANLLNAVFNEKYEVVQNSGTKWTIARQNGKKKFAIFALNVKQNIELKTGLGVEGTCLQFSIPARSKLGDKKGRAYPCRKIYIRFRLRTPKIERFMREYAGPSVLLSQFTKRVAIDFRYNDTRSFNNAELEEFETNQKCFALTQKVHFLLMSKAYINVECATDVKRRSIERDLWSSYVQSTKCNVGQNTDDIIAYHATKKVDLQQGDNGKSEDIGAFEFFAKQSVESFEVWKLFLASAMLGAVGNAVWDLVCWIFSFFFDLLEG